MGDLQIAVEDEEVGDAAEGNDGDVAMAESKEAAGEAARFQLLSIETTTRFTAPLVQLVLFLSARAFVHESSS